MNFLRASISIKELNIDMLIKNIEVRKMKINPYFSNLKQPIFCLFSY